MQEMIELLGSVREKDPAGPASPETVAADVARGRRAQARRRTVGTAVVAAVAAVTVVAVGTGGTGAGTRAHEVAAPPSRAQQTQQHTLAVQLEAYSGAQPAGFTVATVPAGWTVRSSDAYAFVVEPPGSAKSAGSERAGDFRNAIAVMLQGDSTGPTFDVTSVSVDGHPGRLGLTQDRGAKWLVYPDGSGHQVLVQVPVGFQLSGGRSVALTDAQIVQFARGIAVTGAAQAAKG